MFQVIFVPNHKVDHIFLILSRLVPFMAQRSLIIYTPGVFDLKSTKLMKPTAYLSHTFTPTNIARAKQKNLPTVFPSRLAQKSSNDPICHCVPPASTASAVTMTTSCKLHLPCEMNIGSSQSIAFLSAIVLFLDVQSITRLLFSTIFLPNNYIMGVILNAYNKLVWVGTETSLER